MVERHFTEPVVRQVPRPFEFHWGKGMVVEEASVEAPYNEPTIQLLQFEDGSFSVRFCYYRGPRFGRGPLMMDDVSVAEMREALMETPRLREMMRNMVAE